MSFSDVATTYSSGDQSIVMLIHPDDNWVIQRFHRAVDFHHVKRIATELLMSAPINAFCSDGSVYTYSLIQLHSRLIDSDDTDHSIRWARIECLNELDSSNALDWIRKNWIKFFWDILRAIIGMHLCGFHHGDVSLDNIGVRSGHFVLYDYNLSRSRKHLLDDIARDIYRLVRSIRWHYGSTLTDAEETLLDWMLRIRTTDEFVEYVMDHFELSTYATALRFLDALTLVPHPTQTQEKYYSTKNQE